MFVKLYAGNSRDKFYRNWPGFVCVWGGGWGGRMGVVLSKKNDKERMDANRTQGGPK